MSRKAEQGHVAVLVAPEITTISVLEQARLAAREMGGLIVGQPDRRDHGIFSYEGRDIDLRAANLHAVVFTMERL